MIEFPNGRFDVILSDPPWRFETRSEKGRDRSPDGAAPKSRAAQRRNQPERHYPTMNMEELKALPVADIAEKNCALFMWVIDPMLPHALELGKAWGFKYATVGFYWAKLRKDGQAPKKGRNEHLDQERRDFPMGTGYWTRANPEQCWLFTRGNPKRISAGVSKLIAMEDYPGDRLIVEPRREHSRKPDEQYRRIDALMGGRATCSKIEMFARQPWKGWTAWGNQTGRFEAGGGLVKPTRRSLAELLGDGAGVDG